MIDEGLNWVSIIGPGVSDHTTPEQGGWDPMPIGGQL